MTSDAFDGGTGGFARNMSAPPRSTISFRPYGAAPYNPSRLKIAQRAAGLRRILRASPDVLLGVHLPALLEDMRGARLESLAAARRRDMQKARERIAQVRTLRLAGLAVLASNLDGAGPRLDAACLAGLSAEALQDRLSDLAGRLPGCTSLPAMAVAEPAGVRASVVRSSTTNILPVLWTLTHLNGRTFDRDGPPLLAPDLAEGAAWDLYAP